MKGQPASRKARQLRRERSAVLAAPTVTPRQGSGHAGAAGPGRFPDPAQAACATGDVAATGLSLREPAAGQRSFPEAPAPLASFVGLLRRRETSSPARDTQLRPRHPRGADGAVPDRGNQAPGRHRAAGPLRHGTGGTRHEQQDLRPPHRPPDRRPAALQPPPQRRAGCELRLTIARPDFDANGGRITRNRYVKVVTYDTRQAAVLAREYHVGEFVEVLADDVRSERPWYSDRQKSWLSGGVTFSLTRIRKVTALTTEPGEVPADATPEDETEATSPEAAETVPVA